MTNEENTGTDTQNAPACDVVFTRVTNIYGDLTENYRASEVMTRGFLAGFKPGSIYSPRSVKNALKRNPAINARFVT